MKITIIFLQQITYQVSKHKSGLCAKHMKYNILNVKQYLDQKYIYIYNSGKVKLVLDKSKDV